MEVSDNRLIEIYNRGWKDCSIGTDNSNFYLDEKLTAYNLGWRNYNLGDDVKSLDTLTDKQILKLIKDK